MKKLLKHLASCLGRRHPELLVRLRYLLRFHKRINLEHPKDLNEKILWLDDYKAEKIVQKLKNNENLIVKNMPIKQYDLNGNFIAEYETTVDAIKVVNPNTNNPRSSCGHISQVINGTRKTAYGY